MIRGGATPCGPISGCPTFEHTYGIFAFASSTLTSLMAFSLSLPWAPWRFISALTKINWFSRFLFLSNSSHSWLSKALIIANFSAPFASSAAIRSLASPDYCNPSRPFEVNPSTSLALSGEVSLNSQHSAWIAVRPTRRLSQTSAFLDRRMSRKIQSSSSSTRLETELPAATGGTVPIASAYASRNIMKLHPRPREAQRRQCRTSVDWTSLQQMELPATSRLFVINRAG